MPGLPLIHVRRAALVVIASVLAPAGSAADGVKPFADVTGAVGLGGNTGGVAAWGDLDADGWVDLCIGGEVWRNEGGKRFMKLTRVSGPAVWGDFDNDGRLDLFAWDGGKLFRNRDGRSFEEVKMPPLPTKVSLGAAWGDFNRDGFLDLYVGGYEVWPNEEFPDVILMNQKGKGFVETWRQTQVRRARRLIAADFADRLAIYQSEAPGDPTTRSGRRS